MDIKGRLVADRAVTAVATASTELTDALVKAAKHFRDGEKVKGLAWLIAAREMAKAIGETFETMGVGADDEPS